MEYIAVSITLRIQGPNLVDKRVQAGPIIVNSRELLMKTCLSQNS